MDAWSIEKSRSAYRVDGWGAGYFAINDKGNVTVSPSGDGPGLDLHTLVKDLVKRGIQPPLLLRFDGIIRARAHSIYAAFDKAIEEANYQGTYTLTYPVKVNQQRQVVETVKQLAKSRSIGLEVGSKPELLAVLAMNDIPHGLLLCNGYKDYQLIELALMSQKLGLQPIITVEQFYELETILRASEAIGVAPQIGLRMNPAYRGSGMWAGSSGENAKFGLALYEIVEAAQQLKAKGLEGCVKLLHFHIGSQITAINAIKKVMKEVARVYVELAKLCPAIEYLDVGGGLGVDYDGSRTSFESSMNYSTEQYARDIVWEVKQACDAAGIQHPKLISESGRALVAHHAVLITEVMDVAEVPEPPAILDAPPSDLTKLQDIATLYNELNLKNCHEAYTDAIALRDDFLQSFVQGNISLKERAYAERSLKFLFTKIYALAQTMKNAPEDLERLGEMLKDTYFVNFSVFQSMLDHWAIGQLFPIMPIHRLQHQPTRRAIIADLTCDSDGKIDKFIDLRAVSRHIDLHPYKPDQPYYIGFFLLGAYQECLGNLHNLFGDTNAIHVEVTAQGEAEILSVVEGDTIQEVLSYVQYPVEDLLNRITNSIEKAVRRGTMSAEESANFKRKYKDSLAGYTYLLWESPKGS